MPVYDLFGPFELSIPGIIMRSQLQPFHYASLSSIDIAVILRYLSPILKKYLTAYSVPQVKKVSETNTGWRGNTV